MNTKKSFQKPIQLKFDSFNENYEIKHPDENSIH